MTNDEIHQDLSTPLYHYTSLEGLVGIIGKKSLWATHIAQLNDSTEVGYAVDLLKGRINKILWEHSPSPEDRKCLVQLQAWLSERTLQSHLIFTCSFSEHGNLLSQWRAYAPSSGGVSLGFDMKELRASADLQGFQLTKCVYEIEMQEALLQKWLMQVVTTKDGKEEPANKAHSTQSLYAHFRAHQDSFLQLAARIKNPAFSEEREWRLISGVSIHPQDPRLRFRVGRSRLVPYVDFVLPLKGATNVSLRTVYVGPAQDPNLSFESIRGFLLHSGAVVTKGIRASGIPLRNW